MNISNLYHHVITSTFVLPDNFEIPVTFGMFTSSRTGPPLEELDVKARNELLLQLLALNRDFVDRTGEPLLDKSQIEHDVKEALYQHGTVLMYTDEFVPVKRGDISLVVWKN